MYTYMIEGRGRGHVSHVPFLVFTLVMLFVAGVEDIVGEEIVQQNVVIDELREMEGHHMTQMLQEADGTLWVSTWDGLYSYDGYDFECHKSQPGNGVPMHSDRARNMRPGQDCIYVLLDSTVFSFDPVTYRFSEPTDEVQDSVKHQFATTRGATRMYHGEVDGIALPREKMRVLRDIDGDLYALSNDLLIRIIKENVPWEIELPSAPVRSIVELTDGKVAVGTQEGMTIGGERVKAVGNRSVYSIAEMPDGSLWVGGKPEGLMHIGTDGKVLDEIEVDGGIYEIILVGEDSALVSTGQYGLLLLRREGGKWALGPVEGYPTETNQRSRGLMVEGDTIVVSTTEGIVCGKLRGDRIEGVVVHRREADRESSLSADATMNTMVDGDSIIVCTESHGFDRISRTDLLRAGSDFAHYSTEDGLTSDILLSGAVIRGSKLIVGKTQLMLLSRGEQMRTYWVDSYYFTDARPIVCKDGTCLIGTSVGLARLDWSKMKVEARMPRLKWKKIVVSDGRKFQVPDTIERLVLGPEGRTVRIDFAAINLKSSRRTRYEYAIERDGDKRGWTEVCGRSVMIADMEPGEYSLKVRSTDSQGRWRDNVRTMHISVPPVFMETTLAKALIMMAVLALILVALGTIRHVLRMNRQHKELLDAYLSMLDRAKGEENKEGDSSEGNDKTTGNAETEETAEPQKRVTDDPTMRRIMAFIEQHIGDSEVRMSDMAEAAATSLSGLSRKTRSMVGLTPAELLKSARLKRAGDMLRESSAPVADIALDCGFTDAKYFSKCFKQSFGKTPTEWREEDR